MGNATLEALKPPEEAQGFQFVYIAFERSIEIARSPEQLWPFVVDYCSWQNYGRRETLFGERDREGEVVLLQKDERGLQGFPPYYARTVQIIENERFLWKTFPATGGEYGDFFGFVDFRLHPSNGHTRFSTTTTYEFRLRDQSPEALKAFKDSTSKEFKTLIDDILPKLKALAEAG